jgi:hypothetical protein
VVTGRAKIGASAHPITDHGSFLLQPIDQLRAIAIIYVDHGRRAGLRLLFRKSGEELRFRLEIILHRPVKIEMVLRQIGEDSNVPFESARPVLRDRVG